MQINICSRTGRKVSIKACICSESPSFSQNIYIHLCKCVCMGDELYKQYSLTSVFFYIHDDICECIWGRVCECTSAFKIFTSYP